MKQLLYSLFAKRDARKAISQLKTLESKLISQRARFAIPFVFKGKGFFKSIECMQNPFEIEAFYHFICELQPKNVLEIGTAKGGALYLWLQAADEKATVVSVDLPHGEFGGGYPPARIPFYQSFAKKNQTLYLLQADSHAEQTITQVKQIFAKTQLDFLFIDGDHTFEGASKDFENYGPLVRPGGWIAFHDILPRQDIPQIQVDRLWASLSQKYETWELVGDEHSGRKIGCGFLKVPETGL